MLLKIYPENPNEKAIEKVVECLKKGGVVIIPTDTVYCFSCDIMNHKAISRICRIKKIDPRKVNFSFVCSDLSHLADYAKVSNHTFKFMKNCLPGPFTFILPAKASVPEIFQINKRTVGIRVPDNTITRAIVKSLGNPITSSTIEIDLLSIEYSTDPELIHEKYGDLVDIVIDGGIGETEFSTVLDCTEDEIMLVREGKGKIE